MTVHLDSVIEQRLQHLAARQHRTPDELAKEDVERLLAFEEDVQAKITRGREDITAGRVVDHDEVVRRIESLLQSR